MRVPGKSLEVRGLTFDESRDFCSSFYTAEGCSSPRPSCDQLESRQADMGVSCKRVGVKTRRNLRAGGDLHS